MRPLNRPMFRYGGPIKEGIMQGMRDGGLANNEGPRRAALVGNPAYDQTKGPDGRTRHVVPIVAGLGSAALRFLPAAIRGFRAARTYKPLSQNLGFMGRAKDLFMPRGGIKAPMAPRGAGAGFRVGSFLRQNPLTAAPLAATVLEGGVGLAKKLPDALKSYADAVIPFADPFKSSEMLEKKEGDTGDIKRVDTIGAGEGTTGGSVAEDPNKAKQIQEDRIAKTKKRYYELMGIDKMKKDAAYDSLIDASKIVQQEGADLKGAIKSGSIQNQIISAISKNLDKSADIKRQIDAAILKGEIQKDVASADSLDRDLKKARIKTLERGEKQASASGQIAAIMAKSDGVILGSQTAAILRNDNIKYDGILQDKLFNNFKKDNPAADEIDFMIAKGKDLDDGRYVIGARLVEKKGNEVAFIV
jgi:ribosomal protein L18